MTRTAKSTAESPAEAVVVTPLPLDPASGESAGQAPKAPVEPAPVAEAPKKKSNSTKVFEKLDEIEIMAGYASAEVRDTIRVRSAEIRDILS